MVMEYRFGLMELNMKDNGNIIKLMVRGNSLMLMGIFMMVIGKMIWLVVMEYMFILMVQNMKVNGLMINNVDMVMKYGLMVQNIEDIILED